MRKSLDTQFSAVLRALAGHPEGISTRAVGAAIAPKLNPEKLVRRWRGRLASFIKNGQGAAISRKRMTLQEEIERGARRVAAEDLKRGFELGLVDKLAGPHRGRWLWRLTRDGESLLGLDSWEDEAKAALRAIAATGEPFTSDDLWGQGLRKPAEPRALGHVLRWAHGEGVIKPTGVYIRSRAESRHRPEVKQWIGCQ